jgi:2-amino-4-hydroxy-6-hydroxymethyldihydropteridine diphosphokinase
VILIGIGSNLETPPYKTPREVAEAALAALSARGVVIARRSSWYLSEPVPRSDQPWFVNGVASVTTRLDAPTLLAELLALEGEFARVRAERNAARTLDLDLLDYDGLVCDTAALTLPHPRLRERRFVLAPLCEIAPDWRHPVLGVSAAEMMARLPEGQPIRRFGESVVRETR